MVWSAGCFSEKLQCPPLSSVLLSQARNRSTEEKGVLFTNQRVIVSDQSKQPFKKGRIICSFTPRLMGRNGELTRRGVSLGTDASDARMLGCSQGQLKKRVRKE